MVYTRDHMRREHAAILENARHVQIDPERVRLVATVMGQQIQDAQSANLGRSPSPLDTLELDEMQSLQFFFAHMTQIFLIWHRRDDGQVEAWNVEVNGRTYVGGPGIEAAHVRALAEGKDLSDPAYLASMTLADAVDIYRDERTGRTTLQMLPQRVAKFNEVGRVLIERYSGHVSNIVRQCDGYLFREDGGGLIQRLSLDFPTAYFDWPFCKLAYLFGKGLESRAHSSEALTPSFREMCAIRDPENFEISADYYIPLFFIRTGIFRISDEFARLLTEQQLIERDGAIEREYRAATVAVGRMIADQTGCSTADVGYHCWQQGYLRCRVCRSGVSDEELPCAYRDLSIGYQSDPRLMQMRWPLVLTTSY